MIYKNIDSNSVHGQLDSKFTISHEYPLNSYTFPKKDIITFSQFSRKTTFMWNNSLNNRAYKMQALDFFCMHFKYENKINSVLSVSLKKKKKKIVESVW